MAILRRDPAEIIDQYVQDCAHLITPCEVAVRLPESVDDDFVRVVMSNRKTMTSKAVRIPSSRLLSSRGNEVFRKAVLALKDKVQEAAAEQLPYGQIRLWAAKHMAVDLMDPAVAIPQRVMRRWQAAHPDREANPDGTITNRNPQDETRVIEPAAEDKPEHREVKRAPMPGRKKELPKKLCPIHKAEMRFVPERNLFKCFEPGCKQIARPKNQTETGDGAVFAKGNINLKVIVSDKRGEIMFALVADNGVVMDITGYVDNLEALKNDINGVMELTAQSDTPHGIKTRVSRNVVLNIRQIHVINADKEITQ